MTDNETATRIVDSIAEKPYSRVYVWFVVGLLMVAYTLSFVDRQILTLLVGPLKADLNLSDTKVGLLQGIAFALFYTVMGIPLGRLVDKINRKWLIVCGVSLWSLMTMGCGIVKSFVTLFLMRMGVGVGEATLNPSAYSIISDYFNKEDLGKALGVYAVGIYIGAGMAYILGGSVAGFVESAFGDTVSLLGLVSVRSWQLTFMIVGLPGLLVVAAIALFLREPVRTGVLLDRTGQQEKISFAAALKFIWASKKTFLPLFFGVSMISTLGYAVLSWGPEFFMRTYGLSKASVGVGFGIIVLIFGSFGIAHAGVMADKMFRKGKLDSYFRVTAIAGVGLIVPCIIMPICSAPSWAFVFLAPIIYFSAFPYSVLPAAIQAISPNQMRGQVSAIYMFVANMTGIGFGPLAVALLTDRFFHSEAALQYSLLIVCAITAPLTAIIFATGFKGLRDSVEKASQW